MQEKNSETPAFHYCRSITRRRLLSLGLAVLLLLVGLCLAVYGWVELQSDRTDWGYTEYGKLFVGLGGALLFLIGVFFGRDEIRSRFLTAFPCGPRMRCAGPTVNMPHGVRNPTRNGRMCCGNTD